MYSVRYGGKRARPQALDLSSNLMVVRARERRPVRASLKNESSAKALRACRTVAAFPEAAVEVFQVPGKGEDPGEARRAQLKQEKGLCFAGRVLCDPLSKEPVLYTENFFVQFKPELPASAARKLLRSRGLEIKRELDYARNAWFVEAPEGSGRKATFETAEKLLRQPEVLLCHPELVRRATHRAFPARQWHLGETMLKGVRLTHHASVADAWELSRGAGVTIAVIDDGVDIGHEEFQGWDKVLWPRDVTRESDNARPYYDDDDHGTACAGVACANGEHRASGVAPSARLMPIRKCSGLGSIDEAQAIAWAVDHGADVISCSWGPPDGDYWDRNDPAHGQVYPLPDSTRLALEYAVTKGRGGKGCVITWAAGNGDEPVDNDLYASDPRVIAIGACNDRGRKSWYSDHGNALWCCFPSGDDPDRKPRTPGIFTTDRMGAKGYGRSNYARDFTGTSSACPGAAGVAALVLARNPALTWKEVKEIFCGCCDKTDKSRARYNRRGHSKQYGFGRLNARRAVELADEAGGRRVVHQSVQRVPVKAGKTVTAEASAGETAPIQHLRVGVDLRHTYVGHLKVSLKPPAACGVGRIVLHDRTGGGANDLVRTYDPGNTPELAQLLGQSPQGKWVLEVHDRGRHRGHIQTLRLEISL